MTLSPALKQSLIIGVVFISMLAVFVVQNVTLTSPKPAPAEVAAEPPALRSVDVTFVPPPTDKESDQTATLALDSHEETLNTISFRLSLENDESTKDASFKINPVLQDAGWNVAFEEVSAESEGDYLRFDLALVNTKPSGGSVFTQEIPLGSLNGVTEPAVRSLNSLLSVASTVRGEQLNLTLVRTQ